MEVSFFLSVASSREGNIRFSVIVFAAEEEVSNRLQVQHRYLRARILCNVVNQYFSCEFRVAEGVENWGNTFTLAR